MAETSKPALAMPATLLRLALLGLSVAGCAVRVGEQDGPQRPAASVSRSNETTPGVSPPGQEADPERQAKALAQFNRAATMLEQHQCAPAAETLEKVVQSAPDWEAARFNLALAYFSMQGKEGSLEKGQAACRQVLQANPGHLHARFLLGMFLQQGGKDNEAALDCFRKVHQSDPQDVYAAYKCAEMLATVDRTDEAIALLERIVRQDPGFTSAYYRLFALYRKTRQPEKVAGPMQRFRELNDAELNPPVFVVTTAYGLTGKYSTALDPEGFPSARLEAHSAQVLFSPDVRTVAAPMKAWNWPGGMVNIPGIAVGDINGDGHLDLVLAGTGENGAVTLWINDGKGNFSPGGQVADQGMSPCLGDVDNNGTLDLWLGRAGGDALYLNDGKGKFTKAPAPTSASGTSLTSSARLLDLDADGDLDLLALHWASGSLPAAPDAKPAATRLYNNNRDGTYPDIAAQVGFERPDAPMAAVVYDDFDNDRDLDLVLFPAGKRPIAWVNDRVGRHHTLDAAAMGLSVEGVIGATTGDPNRDGSRDLLVFTGKEVHLYLNRGAWKFELDKDFESRFSSLGGTSGQFVDIDNDGDLDLVIADAHRPDGTRGPVLLINDWPNPRFLNAAEVDPGNLLAATQTKGDAVCVAADFNGDGRCDILLLEMGQSPRLIENLTKGGNYVDVDLAGTQDQGKKTRSSASAIGARVEIRSGSIRQQFVVGTCSSPTAMPPLRLHFGLGGNTEVQWLRVLWPDGVLQAEREFAGGRRVTVTEVQRKPGAMEAGDMRASPAVK